jgi:hypothetical protein
MDPLDQDDYGLDKSNPNKLLDYIETLHFLKYAKETYIPLDPPLDTLNSDLIDKGDEFHERILEPFGVKFDKWNLPGNVETFVIAGSGIPTHGILREREKKWYKFGKPNIDIIWCNGDRSVPLWSAIGVTNPDAHFYYPNLGRVGGDYKHGTILQDWYVQELIKYILKGTYALDSMPEWLREDIKEPHKLPNGYSISLYSPASLTIYDSSGNETGYIDETLFVEDIPGSIYACLGGRDGTKNIFIPDGDIYRVVIKSLTNKGDFDLKIEDIDNDDVIQTVEFLRIPLAENTIVEMSIDQDISNSVLDVDINGDRIVDETFSPTFIDNVLTEQNSDADNVPDRLDNCPSIANEDQTDSDEDGMGDACDGCPNDPNKTALGLCGCGVADTDTDGDETPDCIDGCPNDSNKISEGACGCGVVDTDSDSDGTPDCIDSCPNDSYNDVDGDGICGDMDNCPAVYNPDQKDSDGDEIGDACEPSLEQALIAIDDAIEMETEARDNMMSGNTRELQDKIGDSKNKIDDALAKIGEAWQNGELEGISTRKILQAWFSLDYAKALDNSAILLLNRDKYANRLLARKAIQSALTLKGNAKNVLE